MLTPQQIHDHLLSPDASALIAQADQLRHETLGDGVKLRGLIELSSVCTRNCTYCGLRAGNPLAVRYTLTPAEVLAAAHQAAKLRFGTVVIQAGESTKAIPTAWISELVKRIKGETGQFVTLSLGERPPKDFEVWHQAGADRYLLRFETSDLAFFKQIHPEQSDTATPIGEHPRLYRLRLLKELGYEIGGGIMVGIPGQTFNILTQDIVTFGALQLDMIGLGPYIAHPQTPLGQLPIPHSPNQVPATAEMACRVMALARLMRPTANIPSTTALSSVDPVAGRRMGLQCGANVFMPNLTPAHYRQAYQIYPGKICVKAPEADDMGHLLADFAAIHRHQEIDA